MENVGELGESIESFERRRLAELPVNHAAVELKPLREVEAQQALKVVVRQEFSSVRRQIEDVRHAIASNTEALKLADIPLEQVADSHERATHSFEVLRAEILASTLA